MFIALRAFRLRTFVRVVLDDGPDSGVTLPNHKLARSVPDV